MHTRRHLLLMAAIHLQAPSIAVAAVVAEALLLALLAGEPLLDAPAKDGDDEHEALEEEDDEGGVEGEFLCLCVSVLEC